MNNCGMLVTSELSKIELLGHMTRMVEFGILKSKSMPLTVDGEIILSDMYEKIEEFIYNSNKFQSKLINVPKGERTHAMLNFGLKMSAVKTIFSGKNQNIEFNDMFHMVNILNKITGENQAITIKEGVTSRFWGERKWH